MNILNGIKIADIAKQAGVSASTVCRVIHNNGYVSKEKHEKVMSVISKLNYVPNTVAQSLRKGKSNILGHVLPSAYPNPFFAGIVHGVDMASYENGYHVLSLFSYNNPEQEERIINELISRMVDGIIFTSVANINNLEKVRKYNIPAVLIERPKKAAMTDIILADNLEGSISAVDYLVRHGHEKIAFIGHKLNDNVEIERYNGYVKGLENHGIKFDDELVRFVDAYTTEQGYAAMKSIMRKWGKFTAIFSASDMLAVGILKLLYENRIRVPDDISIIGFDNSLAEILIPGITTVALPMEEMGRAAVKLLIDRLDDTNMVNRTITLHTSIIERASVQKISSV